MGAQTDQFTNAPGAGGGNGMAAEFGMMDTAARRVDAVNQEIAGLLTQVRGRVDALGAGVWHGRAQGVFAGIMAEWDSESRRLNSALDGIAETIRSNRTQFESAEDDHASALNRVASAGPLRL